jgi:hypothetical protein
MSLVVVLWRPDTTTGIGPPATPAHSHVTWIGGRWASDQRIYTRDRLPLAYSGQVGFPRLPFFSQLTEAARYLTASRDHAACQLDLDEFRRAFPDVNLDPAVDEDPP